MTISAPDGTPRSAPAAAPTAPAPPEPTPPGPDASSGAIVRWTVDVINSHRVEPLRAVWTEQTRMRTPTTTHRGPDELAAHHAGLLAAMPDLTVTMQAMVADDAQVLVRWTLTGTHTGAELEGIVAGGARVDLDGVDHVTVADGRILSTFVVYDRVQLARQLGVLPSDGSRVDVGLRRAVNLVRRYLG